MPIFLDPFQFPAKVQWAGGGPVVGGGGYTADQAKTVAYLGTDGALTDYRLPFPERDFLTSPSEARDQVRRVTALAVDSENNIICGAETLIRFPFGGGPNPTLAGPLLAKIGADGGTLWRNIEADTSDDVAPVFQIVTGLACDRDKNIFVVGQFTAANFEVQKRSPTGSLSWTKTLAGTYNQITRTPCVTAAVDKDGNCIAVGSSVVKYDPDGNILWTVSPTDPRGVACSKGGDVYIATDAGVQKRSGEDGSIIWNRDDEFAGGLCVDVSPTGLVLFVSRFRCRVYDADGASQWQSDFDSNARERRGAFSGTSHVIVTDKQDIEFSTPGSTTTNIKWQFKVYSAENGAGGAAYDWGTTTPLHLDVDTGDVLLPLVDRTLLALAHRR